MNINISVVEDGKAPKFMSDGAGCMDVYARDISYDKEYGFLSVKLGFKMEVPEDYILDLMPRSSVSKKGVILCNSPGQIDPDFRGEVEARFYPVISPNLISAIVNGSKDGIEEYMLSIFKKGEAVGQIRLVRNYTRKMELSEVKGGSLSKTKRGDKGFGHTSEKEIS